MKIKNKLIEDFLEGIEEIENPLLCSMFEPFSFETIG